MNLFIEEDRRELEYFLQAAQLRAREFRGAVSFAAFTFPATAIVAFIVANYRGPERAGLIVMVFPAMVLCMAGALWVARDTWLALRAVRWRVETLAARVNETI